MRIALIAATAAFALLGACREQAADTQAENGAAADAAASAPLAAGAAAAAPLGEAISGEAAKTLMHDRHEGMEEIGDAMKAITRELKKAEPDSSVLARSGTTIATLSDQASSWFRPGSGPDVGKTEAKAEIWQKPEDFAAKMRNFQRAADAFVEAQKTGSLATIRAAHADLGKSCKACHDLYREEDH